MFTGKILEIIQLAIEQFDAQNEVTTQSGSHRSPSTDKDMDLIINKLIQLNLLLQVVHYPLQEKVSTLKQVFKGY